MREILFRGKREDNGEWVEGHLLFDEEQDEAYIAEYFEDRSAYIREVIPETVGQYTGLTDKNGKKIFEGDIVGYYSGYRKKYFFGICKYGKFNCSCCHGVYGWFFDDDDIRECSSYEVLGNIHDNPELLGGESDA